ncbi:hypothetical protein [Pedobacter cryoconitis]|uniref:Putative membrane protein n=1 Tax=Pedobacter cryoconitis TaxID=188932 RepID=A0A7X0MI66_9SPHI|nr:hypothetical protein [Pedobacter cryoconitis]MBB6498215.1 putative membrane protein [Pedobacter cryoconitis]
MNSGPNIIPRAIVTSIASGLLLMALFTTMWAGIATGGLQGKDHYLVLTFFCIFILIFIIYSIKLFAAAKRYPEFTSEADKKEGENIKKWFGIIFGIEGITIPIACILLSFLGYQQFILSAIAMIVGLHFYPMAKIFNRKIDYYLATWTCLVSIASITMIVRDTEPFPFIQSFLGIGVAFATTAYGVNMLIQGNHLTRQPV